MRACVGAKEDVLVDPLEIEGERNRPAHTLVPEAFAPHVERLNLKARPPLARQDRLDHAALVERGKVVARLPCARGELLAVVQEALLKRLEGDVALGKELDSDRVEVTKAPGRTDLVRPIVGPAIVLDEPADLEPADLVATRAGDGIGKAILELAIGEEVRRQDRHGRNEEDVAWALRAVEGEPHTVLARRLRVLQRAQRDREVGMAGVLQREQGIGDVVARDGQAGREARLGPQREIEAVAVFRDRYGFGE